MYRFFDCNIIKAWNRFSQGFARVIITWRYIRCGRADEGEMRRVSYGHEHKRRMNPPVPSCYFPLTHIFTPLFFLFFSACEKINRRKRNKTKIFFFFFFFWFCFENSAFLWTPFLLCCLLIHDRVMTGYTIPYLLCTGTSNIWCIPQCVLHMCSYPVMLAIPPQKKNTFEVSYFLFLSDLF